jgi:hypothetical protein
MKRAGRQRQPSRGLIQEPDARRVQLYFVGVLRERSPIGRASNMQTRTRFCRRRICKAVMVRGRGVERQERFWFWRRVAKVDASPKPDPLKRAAMLVPVKAKPFGRPRKTPPALTVPARGSCENCGRGGRMLAARVEQKNGHHMGRRRERITNG